MAQNSEAYYAVYADKNDPNKQVTKKQELFYNEYFRQNMTQAEMALLEDYNIEV
jgi:hypothetical protein